MKKLYLAVCAMVRDELDLPEWVAYQLSIGVEHVFIYDNESVVPVKETLRNWIAAGKVTVECIRGLRRQRDAFSSFLKKNLSRWVAFIDADEFVVPHEVDDLKMLLVDYESYGGLAVSWQVFGPHNHVSRPKGLVIESYTRKGSPSFDLNERLSTRSPTCWQYKSIVQPQYTARCVTPHYFVYKGNQCAVNERGELAPPKMLLPPSVQKLQLNHYMTKSEEDWKLKQARRGGQSGKARTEDEWFDLVTGCNRIADVSIQRFIPKVKEIVRLRNSDLKQRDVLYAGPWVGEFGWELCWWNPLVRELAKNYRKVIVSAPKTSRYLYEFADEFIELNTRGLSCAEGKLQGSLPPVDPAWDIARPNSLWKRYGASELGALCEEHAVHTPKLWRQLAPTPRYLADVLCAFRPPKIGRTEKKEKDYSPIKCAKVVSLLIDAGFTVACYGGADNYMFKGVLDLRGLPLEMQCSALAGAKTAVGPSSAPLHLASLCKCAHVTWSSQGKYVGFRYQGSWNPFKCPVEFLPSFNPSPEQVVEAVKRSVFGKLQETQHLPFDRLIPRGCSDLSPH